MKKLLLASSALLFCGPVVAADLPSRMSVKAPVVAAVPYSWTGCYVGGHAGAGWDRTNFADPGNPDASFPAITIQNIAPLGSSIGVNGHTAALGGVQTGCDYQFANHWVVGLAGDASWTDIHGLANDPFFANKNNGTTLTLTTRTARLATVTGRVGYAWDHFLLYGKGGAAWAHDQYGVQNLLGLNASFCGTFPATCNPTGSTDRMGWVVGAGFEWAFANNWSAMIEYDHYGFGSKGVGFADPTSLVATTATFNVKQNIDVVKVGINYRFWTPEPVVVRY